MKKITMMMLAAVTGMGGAHAEFKPNSARGGFVGDSESIITIDQIGNLRDDAYVIVQGNIIRRVEGDKYLFQDPSGTIVVEIDDDDWNGVTVTPDDTIKLYGEVDKGLTKTEIDIDYIEKIK